MKIPTTPPGNAPYYHCPPMNGVELNPPWQQGNGVMMEGAANNNGTYIMQQQVLHHGVPPPQPHHAPPNTGYMAQQPAGGGSYYSPSEPEDSPTPPHTQDFSEYMWMGNQEEFDKQVIQQLEEEALMEQCIEAMLADEREGLSRPSDLTMEEQISKSTLNPLAPEFIPSFLPAASISTPADANSAPNTPVTEPCEPPTEALNDLAISKPNKSPVSSEESGEELKKIEKVDSDIVVVSAKSSIDDSEKPSVKRERKDSDKKKSEIKKKTSEPSKKEKAVVAAVALSTAAVVGAKSSKPNTPRPRTQSGGDKPKPTAGERKSTGSVKKADKEEPAPSKKQEVRVDDVVDLQGPPLPSVNVPIVSALSAVPVTEPEKPSPAAPVVFNYAAAAKANLPPKSTPPQQTPPPSKETTPTPVATASKPATTNPAPSKANGAADVRNTKKAESAKPNENKRVSAKGSSVGGGATKKGSKK